MKGLEENRSRQLSEFLVAMAVILLSLAIYASAV